MNCDCLTKTETALSEHYTKHLGTPATAEMAQAWTMEGVFIRIPVRVKANKPGYKAVRGKEVSFFPSFCPVCGVSTKPKLAEGSETIQTMRDDMYGDIEG